MMSRYLAGKSTNYIKIYLYLKIQSTMVAAEIQQQERALQYGVLKWHRKRDSRLDAKMN